MAEVKEADEEEDHDDHHLDVSIDHVHHGLGIVYGSADDASDAVTISANPTPRGEESPHREKRHSQVQLPLPLKAPPLAEASAEAAGDTGYEAAGSEDLEQELEDVHEQEQEADGDDLLATLVSRHVSQHIDDALQAQEGEDAEVKHVDMEVEEHPHEEAAEGAGSMEVPEGESGEVADEAAGSSEEAAQGSDGTTPNAETANPAEEAEEEEEEAREARAGGEVKDTVTEAKADTEGEAAHPLLPTAPAPAGRQSQGEESAKPVPPLPAAEPAKDEVVLEETAASQEAGAEESSTNDLLQEPDTSPAAAAPAGPASTAPADEATAVTADSTSPVLTAEVPVPTLESEQEGREDERLPESPALEETLTGAGPPAEAEEEACMEEQPAQHEPHLSPEATEVTARDQLEGGSGDGAPVAEMKVEAAVQREEEATAPAEKQESEDSMAAAAVPAQDTSYPSTSGPQESPVTARAAEVEPQKELQQQQQQQQQHEQAEEDVLVAATDALDPPPEESTQDVVNGAPIAVESQSPEKTKLPEEETLQPTTTEAAETPPEVPLQEAVPKESLKQEADGTAAPDSTTEGQEVGAALDTTQRPPVTVTNTITASGRVLGQPPPNHPPFRGPNEQSLKWSAKGQVVNIPNAALAHMQDDARVGSKLHVNKKAHDAESFMSFRSASQMGPATSASEFADASERQETASIGQSSEEDLERRSLESSNEVSAPTEQTEEEGVPITSYARLMQKANGQRASSASDSMAMVKVARWSIDDLDKDGDVEAARQSVEAAESQKDPSTQSSQQGSRGGSRPNTQGSGGPRKRACTVAGLNVYLEEAKKQEENRLIQPALASTRSRSKLGKHPRNTLAAHANRRKSHSPSPVSDRSLSEADSAVSQVGHHAAGRLQGLSHLAAPGDQRHSKGGGSRSGSSKKGLAGDIERMLNQVKASDDSLQELDAATNLVQQAIRKTDEIRRMKHNPREVAEQIRREKKEAAEKLERASKASPSSRSSRLSVVQSLYGDQSQSLQGSLSEQQPSSTPREEEEAQEALMRTTGSSLQELREEFEGSRVKDVKMRKEASRKVIITQANSFIGKMKALGDGNIGVAWRRHFDSDGDGELSFAEFCSGLASVNHDGDVVELWQQFAGSAGHMSLQVLDPVSAMILDKFAKWCADFLGGPIEVFRAIDSDGSDSLTPDEFAEGLRELGFFEPENLENMPESLYSEDLVLENLYPLMDQNGRGNIQAEQLLFLEKNVKKKAELQKTLARQRQYGIEAALEPITSEAQHLLEEHARSDHWDIAHDTSQAQELAQRPKRNHRLAPFSENKPLETPFFTKLLVGEKEQKNKELRQHFFRRSLGPLARQQRSTAPEEPILEVEGEDEEEEEGVPEVLAEAEAQTAADKPQNLDNAAAENAALDGEGSRGEPPSGVTAETTMRQPPEQGLASQGPAGPLAKSSLSVASYGASSLPRLHSTSSSQQHPTTMRSGPFSSSTGSLSSMRSKAHVRKTRAIYAGSQVPDLPDISTYTSATPKAYFEEVARISPKFQRSNGQWAVKVRPKADKFNPSKSVDFFCQAKRGSLYSHYGVHHAQ